MEEKIRKCFIKSFKLSSINYVYTNPLFTERTGINHTNKINRKISLIGFDDMHGNGNRNGCQNKSLRDFVQHSYHWNWMQTN